MTEENEKITEQSVSQAWPHAISYLTEILRGEYSVDEAREDILSIINAARKVS